MQNRRITRIATAKWRLRKAQDLTSKKRLGVHGGAPGEDVSDGTIGAAAIGVNRAIVIVFLKLLLYSFAEVRQGDVKWQNMTMTRAPKASARMTIIR
jgi:hypothetical protein